MVPKPPSAFPAPPTPTEPPQPLCCRELVKNQGTKMEVLGINKVQETKNLSCSTSMEIAKVFFAPELEELKFQGALQCTAVGPSGISLIYFRGALQYAAVPRRN